ncbi:MAG TPA: DUF6069 family protein [Trebonia sp.]|jgi:hypothetical protein|nr:DUF6069 family protein [Trebonia sp.]
MTYPASPADAGSPRVRPDSGQFWAGAVATAIVAALIALVGILICRWTLKIPILAPAGDGAWGDAHTGEYVLVAALVALAAAGLLYLLMLGAPNPDLFFRWIIGLVTLIAVVYPFSSGAPLEQKVATAAVNLVLGLAIASLLTATAARAIRRTVPRPRPNPLDNGPAVAADPARPAPTRIDRGAPADPYGRRGQGYDQTPTRPTYTPGNQRPDGWD